jgi:hypothetical protein
VLGSKQPAREQRRYVEHEIAIEPELNCVLAYAAERRSVPFRSPPTIMDAPKPLELIYTSVDGLDLFMDVFVPEGATESSKAPVFIWWHGSPQLCL